PGGLLRRGSRRLPPRARRAAEAFAAFEARWSARGVSRRPGQTAMELAVELERRALLPSGEARSFVASYYQDRFGR
ncbi:MAG: DUF4129 domain-containing protein, partial [Candidatus Polarisedimenticolia bacterium]